MWLKHSRLLSVLTLLSFVAAPCLAADGTGGAKADGGSETITADIVIAGAGLSGLAAGLTGVENGAKVVIFEKLPGIGGAGNYPEGSFGINSRLQKQSGDPRYNKSPEEAFAAGVEFHHWRLNSALLSTLIRNSGDTMDWLQDEGIKFKGIKTMFPPEKSLGVWHIYEGHGARVVQTMYRKFASLGGQLYLETPVKSLLTGKDGRVIGIVAEDAHGKKYNVYAKGVILATGGFASNQAMLQKYVTDINAKGMLAGVRYRGPLIDGRTGDGINMAMGQGAAVQSMNVLAGNAPYLDTKEPPIYQFNGPDSLKQMRTALSQPFLWVNQHGDRFYNESLGSAFVDVYNAITANGGVMYSVFDENMKNRLVNEGPYTPFNAIVVVGQKMTALDEGLKKGLEGGYAFKADTIPELAKMIHVDPAALEATMSKINAYAEAGKDPDFGRKPEHLFKFNPTGPYYALKGIRAFFLTCGGVKVNASMQAVNDRDEPIPGLYVTGQDMGGLSDTSYDLLLEGEASGFALTSGRLAARNIVTTELAK